MSATIGVALGITGGVIDNIGVTLQKLSHRRMSKESAKGAYVCRPLWAGGFGLYMAGNVVNAVGLSLAPQSLFATLGPLSLVTNTM